MANQNFDYVQVVELVVKAAIYNVVISVPMNPSGREAFSPGMDLKVTGVSTSRPL